MIYPLSKSFSKITVVLIISLISCNGNKNEDSFLIPSETLSLSIPNNINCISQSIEYYFSRDSGQYLYYLDEMTNRIVIFNLEDKSIVKNFEMQKVGPEGVGNIKSIYFHHPDTILLTTGQMNAIYHINSKGEYVKKINILQYINNEQYSTYVSHSKSFCKQLLIHNNSIFAGTHLTNIFQSQDELSGFRLCLKVNFENGYQELLPLKFPYLNTRNLPAYSYFSKTCVNGKFVYSFLHSDLMLSTYDHIHAKQFTAKSKFRKKEFKMPDFSAGMLRIARTIVETPSYLGFYYDKYRKVYYRFAYPGIEVKNSDNLIELNKFKQVFSIMILDEDLSIIGEQLLPSNSYNIDMAFVGKDGLWVSTNHIENPSFDENCLKFQLFTLNLITNL